MKISRIITVGISAILMVGTVAALQAETDAPKQEVDISVEYRVIGPDDFQRFVKNWDNKTHPVLYAAIRSPDEWNAVFGSAPVMGGNRPFGPDRMLYDGEQILVVSRVVTPSSTFKVESVSENKNELILRYNFVAKVSEASFSIKQHIAVVIPKHDYRTIVFIENGKRIGVLNMEKGQWSVPAMPNPKDGGGDK